jgi:hypothetical protein
MIGEYLEIQKKTLSKENLNSKDLECLVHQIIEFYDKGKGKKENILKKDELWFWMEFNS